MTRRRVVSMRELGLIVAVLALPVAVVQTGSNLPLLGGTASHGGTPVALGVRATAVEGSQAAHISKGTTTSDERARPDAHMGGAVSFVQTAGDDSSGGVPPAQGDPGRAGGGGSGARSPGAPADPPTPSDEPRDPAPAPGGSGGASDPNESPSPAPSPPESAAEPSPATERRDLTASMAAGGAEAEVSVDDDLRIDVAAGTGAVSTVELTVSSPLLP